MAYDSQITNVQDEVVECAQAKMLDCVQNNRLRADGGLVQRRDWWPSEDDDAALMVAKAKLELQNGSGGPWGYPPTNRASSLSRGECGGGDLDRCIEIRIGEIDRQIVRSR